MACISTQLSAQVPAVEWLKEHALAERPPGLSYIWNPTTLLYEYPSLPFSDVVPQSASGIDWFNDVCLVRNASGEHIGYAVAGYSYIPNFFTNYGACSVTPNGQVGPPVPLALETFEYRKGAITGTVAYYDLGGVRQWYHTYMDAAYFGIIQDKNGDLVVSGTTAQMVPWPGMPWSAQPLLYNPISGQTSYNMATATCLGHARKLVLMKVRVSDGYALWNHVFGLEDDPAVGSEVSTAGYAVAEVDPDGIGGYRAVGYWDGPVGHPLAGKRRPFMVDVDVNGMLNWKQIFDASHPSGLWPDADAGSAAFRIVRHPDPTVDRFLVTGSRSHNPGAGSVSSAFLLSYANNTATPTWAEDTYVNNTEYGLATTSKCVANRAAYAVSGGNTTIVWPVLSDFFGADFAANNHEATGRVYRMDLTGTQQWPAVNLGPMRGYDLAFSANQRANGNIVVGCTKSSQSTTPLVFGALSTAVQNCLQTTYGYDPNNDPNTAPAPYNWQGVTITHWGHWLSDSYMAELDLATGTPVWQGTWDADVVNGATPTCAPDNIRMRQCSFNVVEADDGGLVSCGNTGHAVEDGYLIKFSGCETDPTRYIAFHALYPYESDHTYTLTATTTTWSSSMNVEGSIEVPAGKTLTINNNAVISLADSRRVGYTTNIVVQPGGTLNVMSGARLTNIDPCGDGMWDGIKALGNTNLAQSPSNQATVQVTSGATIENAFVAVLAAEADINDPIGSAATQRGARVICTNATFRNNIYDVVLRPFNCGSGCASDFTVTKFHECDFLTTGPLNYADRTPKIHLYANSYPRIWVRGCTFDGTNTGLDVNNVAAWGKGIESFNTDLRINSLNGRDPHFNSLESGCFAANPNGKTVRVDGAFFDGNGHGLGIVAAGTAHVTNCDFKEPDLDMVGQGLGAPVYGTYLDGTPTILFENNAFVADGSPFSNPCVGSTFKDLGPNDNTFFNNTYSGFTGTNGAQYSAGVTIQGVNDGNALGDGLKFKCNDFSFGGSQWADDFDMAFTGPNVSVALIQGSDIQPDAPAGNTFLMNCTGEAHMKVDDVPNNAGLYFQYFHHAATPGAELIPTCLTNPPLDPTPYTGINQPTGLTYSKSTACGSGSMMMMAGGGSGAAGQAASASDEQVTLKAVYDDWTDGGNTEGLAEYVANPANTSYQVRNQLMLVAPKVSSEVWKLVFERLADMNPWHMAQALIANSPLEPDVNRMMEESDLTPYYKQLVVNEQGGGMNMQTIMESELAYWYSEQSQALLVYSALAMDEEPSVTIAEAIALHEQYPVQGSVERIYLLRLAAGDLAGARADMDAMIGVDHDAWWDVQNIHLNMLETGAEAPSSAQEATLEAIATADGNEATAARAWFAQLNGSPTEVAIILPGTGTRSFLGGKGVTAVLPPEMLGVYPNPTKGEAFVTYKLPDGATQGELRVHDATGRLVRAVNLMRSGGIVDLPKSELSSGTYAVSLRADGILVGTVKFIALR
ncbi:MAG: T9SS type A sorting domain-containing protein [Flavobacteriales bacterium]|nr:T9SS type A sorting domain-containing protein [Flavobacteriales bacterium]